MSNSTPDIWLIGIGTGSLSHVTLEGIEALKGADVILMPRKGAEKDDLVTVRREIFAASGSEARIAYFDYPTRDPDLPYDTRVSRWHDEIALRWQAALEETPTAGPVALLVWGDPSLYDSTLRIAGRLHPKPTVRVVPGITAVQALTAAHAVPLNTVNGSIHITTGRRLRNSGMPDDGSTVVVMLDADCSFRNLHASDLYIWWGAYLGSKNEILLHGPVHEISDEIVRIRAEARAKHKWIMDSYLLRRV